MTFDVFFSKAAHLEINVTGTLAKRASENWYVCIQTIRKRICYSFSPCCYKSYVTCISDTLLS